MAFRPELTPTPGAGGRALWFAFQGDLLLVESDGGRVSLPRMSDPAERGLLALRTLHLGTLSGEPCRCAELGGAPEPPPGMSFSPLRPLLGVLDEELFALAGRAFQVVDWDRTHRYCSRCAVPLEDSAGERSKRCPRCGLVFYPQVSPAVIVAVERGDRILLARSQRFGGAGFFSVLAGFVEPGETFEECVAREVREEVGIEVGDIRYFGSQPWPFPHSIMVGFTAAHAGGEIAADEREIAEAGWFTASALPPVPRAGTIARRLIDRFAGRSGRRDGG